VGFWKTHGPGSHLVDCIHICQLAVPLHLHGEVYIPVKDIQMVKKLLQLLCSMQSDDKSDINIIEPVQHVGV
jgi:hypothetical protein